MDLKKAAWVQLRLAEKLSFEPLPSFPRLVGGADFAFDHVSGKIGAALVVFEASSWRVVDEATAVAKCPCPYIPGFLCFREGPVFFQAFRQLQRPPEVWLIDGNGLAHPRRMGLASFIGVVGRLSTIGCAKTAFFPYEPPPLARGSYSVYYNKKGEKVGFCLRTRDNVKPVFVSPGHRVGFEDCLEIVLSFSRFRLPEPLRQAHLRAKKIFSASPSV